MNNTKENFHLEEVDHSYIRYANVWEDPYLLSEGLKLPKGGKALSIASAGDNAFALLMDDPELVVAIDLNKVQIYLTELKREAIKQLTQQEMIGFLGYRSISNRWAIYQSIRSNLRKESQIYWDSQKQVIEKGVAMQGKFEKYLASFSKYILPFIHNDKKVTQLLSQKPEIDQQYFYNDNWNSTRWRFLFKLFFSKKVMGVFGRDPAFLDQVEVNVGKTIMENAARHLSSIHAQNNPILYYCLNGDFGDYLPKYLRPENYGIIKNNMERLELYLGYAQEASSMYGKFNAFNMSNIFEYMDPAVFKGTSQSLIDSAAPGARFAYWNLMVPRLMSHMDERVVRVEDNQNWAARDQGFFYSQFVVDELRS